MNFTVRATHAKGEGVSETDEHQQQAANGKIRRMRRRELGSGDPFCYLLHTRQAQAAALGKEG